MKFGHNKDEPAPPDLVFDEDEDLGEVWLQVVRQYEDTTKKKLDFTTTFKSFQLQVDADIKESTTKSHQHARTVLNNVGTCLEKFGSIVAQGASVVFGPTAQCWNAISFVIQAARGFSDMMDGFVTLMERSSAFLRRLVYFLEQEVGKDGTYLPRPLRRSAYEILSQFLGVLRSSYKLATSTRERMKSMAGMILFNSNDAVAESLQLMENHIQEFTRAEADVILVGVRGLAKHLVKSDEERRAHKTEILEYVQATYKVGDQVLSVTQQMKTTLDGRANKDQQKENLVKIANNLGLKKPGNWETWNKRHSELCKTHVEGTGEWLSQDEPVFIQWADLEQHDKKVLFLKADSGFGKTHLFNHVVSHLEKKCRAARGPNQAFLAYYYYGEEKDDSLERCIGSIIYQFAAADVGYAQAVVEECARLTSIARAEDRWHNLVSGLQHAMKGTYFICMDGFDSRGQLDTAEAMMSTIAGQAASSAKSNGVSIRLFVSGNDDALSEVSQTVKAVDTILLGKRKDTIQSMERAGYIPDIASDSLPNARDLRAVTSARIEEVCRTKPGLKALLSDANIELLLEGIRGNYRNLEAKITEINACDTKGKVQEIISNTSADMNAVQRNRIKMLDALLTSRQAQVLNSLLVWVAGCSYPPKIKLLESVLFFTFREDFLLTDQVATTYSPVLTIDKEGRVGFKDGLRDILSANTSSGAESAIAQLHAEAITSAEVELCRRFIRKACDATDYARFRFDDFFEAMAQKKHIHLDDDNTVNVTIISLCIDVLFDSRKDGSLEAMREYASLWFYEYLKTLVKALDEFEPERKFMTDIGGKLVDLFYDPKMIDMWFSKKNLTWLKYDYLYSEEFLDPILALLKNSQVAKGYAKDAEKSEWAKSVISDTASKYSVLERIAARLATHWFSCATGTTDRDYLWISWGIVAKISKPEKPFEEWKPPSNAEVNEYILWVKKQKDINVDSAVWDYRVGATNVVFEHYKEAITALEKAEKHSQTNWGLYFSLAEAHENEKNHRTALGYVRNFKSLSEKFLETDDAYKEAYWLLLKVEGNCYRECHEHGMAVQSFHDLLNQIISEASGMSWLHLHALSGLFTTWTDTKSPQSIIDLIRSWTTATAENRGATYWLRRASRENALHTCIIVAAKHVGAEEEIISMYQEAIDYKPPDQPIVDGQPGMDNSAEATKQLQYFQAVLKFHGGNSHEYHHESIKCWEDIVMQSDENPASYMTAWHAARKLAPTLLDKAVAKTLPALSSSSEDYISRLKKLASSNTTIICNLHEGYFDPRLCLARLYCVKEDHTSASTQAQARLWSVFDKWPEVTDDASLNLRFSNLAATLTVLDKDADAIAAWQAIGPYQPLNAVAASADVPGTEEFTHSNTEGPHTDSAPVASDKKSEDISNAATSFTTTTKAYVLGYICDGYCGVKWTDMVADCWACKHCLCVQLCPGCYKKLLDGDLHPLLCNKDHKMLYIPPFDWEAWRTIPADMMTVDNKLVPRKDWVDKIRKEYNVQQDEIDFIKIEKARGLKAASVIAVRWRNRLQRLRASRPVAAPALRRAKTVR
ncbi:uncharacterized protein J4E88_010498 [Alternaria novae-zelandiae]|uniref:uncharacterized protein n=1 Tax=Alternaria novae-zelandiae TaxID=430562 RepID=UPI0020C3A700|nr:uncharacterized protein J4E88_010498 [Alternaria novae-zelandiae]KAI4666203.1 hypothetical protein J4E88_010498 [Alternaria novae-zelandiae]